MRKLTSAHILNAQKVVAIYEQAQALIGMEDYEGALRIAGEIDRLGFSVHASYICMDVGKADGQPDAIRKAREIIIPIAKELCENGYHLNEALHYKRLGLENEFTAAWAEYLEALSSPNAQERISAVAEREILEESKKYMN